MTASSYPVIHKFSCCRNDACVEGGKSVLLDAFAVVEELREKHPQHFATLSRIPATFERTHPMKLVQFWKMNGTPTYMTEKKPNNLVTVSMLGHARHQK